MSKSNFTKYLAEKITELKTEGLYKAERVITSQQQTVASQKFFLVLA